LDCGEIGSFKEWKDGARPFRKLRTQHPPKEPNPPTKKKKNPKKKKKQKKKKKNTLHQKTHN